MSFFSLSLALLWVPYISSCRGGARSRRTKRTFLPWFCTLLLVGTAWFKLFAMTSLMNKMKGHGLWCSTTEYLDLKYAFTNAPAEKVPNCSPVWFQGSIRQTLVYAVITVGFHMLMYFARQPRSAVGKLFGLLPVCLIVGLLIVKPITSLMVNERGAGEGGRRAAL